MYSQLIAQDDSPSLRFARANVWAEIGRWDEAIDDFHYVIHSGEASYYTWYLKALAHLGADDERGYQHTASEMAREFANTSNQSEAHFTTWTLALGPQTQVEPQAGFAIASKLFDDNILTSSDRRTLGALLLRYGGYEDAVKMLAEASSGFDQETQITSPSYGLYLLAMANVAIGKVAEGQKYFDEAVKSDVTADSENSAIAQAAWNRRLTLRLLHDEARNRIDRLLTDRSDPKPELEQDVADLLVQFRQQLADFNKHRRVLANEQFLDELHRQLLPLKSQDQFEAQQIAARLEAFVQSMDEGSKGISDRLHKIAGEFWRIDCKDESRMAARGAVECARRLSVTQPDNLESQLQLARVLFRSSSRRFTDPIEQTSLLSESRDLLNVLKDHIENGAFSDFYTAAAYRLDGDLRMAEGDPAGARDLYRKSIALRDEPSTYYRLLRWYCHPANSVFDNAAGDAIQALQKHPSHVGVRNASINLADRFLEKNSAESAHAILQVLFAKHRNYDPAVLRMRRIRESEELRQAAIGELQRILGQRSLAEQSPWWPNYCRFLVLDGQHDVLRSFCTETLAALDGHNDPAVIHRFALACIVSDRSLEDWQPLIDLTQRVAVGGDLQAKLWARGGQHDRAIEGMKNHIKDLPQLGGWDLVWLGIMEHGRGNVEAAREYLDRTEKFYSADAVIESLEIELLVQDLKSLLSDTGELVVEQTER